jgi:amidohydrolase
MISLQDLAFLEDEIQENYMALHRHPEVGFHEHWTCDFIYRELTRYGIEAEKVVATGVTGWIAGEKPGPTIAIRADIDALPIQEDSGVVFSSDNPGCMHACGHDSHAAMLLGAAHYFALNRDKLAGNLRLIFQPAEEGMNPESKKIARLNNGDERGGAASMVKLGYLDGVDRFFALHVDPELPIGTLHVCRDRAMASCDRFELTIQGKGGHGSSPEGAIDPIGALSAILAAYNALPSREFSSLETIVISVGTVNTVSSWNIIPDQVTLTGNIRTFNSDVCAQVLKRLKELAEGICLAHRCTADFRSTCMAIPSINDPKVAQEMAQNADRIFGEGHGILAEKPRMGSEDVAYYLNTVPGAFAFFGCAFPDEANAPLHSPRFRLNPETLIRGVQFHVNMVLSCAEEENA